MNRHTASFFNAAIAAFLAAPALAQDHPAILTSMCFR
jgi:hypothetical protein